MNAFFSLLRHLLTAAGVAVIANNSHNYPILGSIDVTQVVGAVMSGIGSIWGITDEYRADQKAKRDALAND